MVPIPLDLVLLDQEFMGLLSARKMKINAYKPYSKTELQVYKPWVQASDHIIIFSPSQ